MLDLSPWNRPVDPIEGVVIHDILAGAVPKNMQTGSY
jgi:hypothetical protein